MVKESSTEMNCVDKCMELCDKVESVVYICIYTRV